MSDFAQRYGPWALVAGASDGVGAAFAEALAERGLDVVLLARRQAVLDQVAAGIQERTGRQTRTLAIDLTTPEASATISAATADLEIGFLVYCAGADPDFAPFLSQPVGAAEAMVRRNCLVPVQLCHHFAAPMVRRGRGGRLRCRPERAADALAPGLHRAAVLGDRRLAALASLLEDDPARS